MGNYRVTYEVKNVSLEELSKRVYASLYLAEIEGEQVRVIDITEPGVEFEYPATQKLLRHLNENPSITGNIQGEGDWQLSDEDKTGEDV